MPRIAFRPLAEDDFPLLFTWLARPHVKRWYAREPGSYLEVAAKYRPRTQAGNPVGAFIIRIDDSDAGYIQKYALDPFPEYRHRLDLDGESGVIGMDLFLGDERRTGRGLGSFVIRRFVLDEVLADPGVSACIAAPHEGNAQSIRAFERAGFRRWRAIENEAGERECVVRRDRDGADYRIATIDIADSATCIRMHREMYAASFGTEEGLEEEMGEGNSLYLGQLQDKLEKWPEGNVHLWRDGRIVGQLEMRLLEDEDDVGYVSLIHVVAEYRGHGLGKRLHQHAMQVSRARGKRLMRLSVSQHNASALRFYKRLGWVVVGARPNRLPMAIMEIPVT
ncbi:MAG: GNAT family N-acetyltransferase [Usitatibacter sp.]